MRRGPGTGERIEHDGIPVRGDAQDVLDERGRLDRVEHVFRPLEVQDADQLLLGVLRVADFGMRPDRLRYDALAHFGQIPLQPRHAGAVRSPPDAIVRIQLGEPLRRYAKVIADRRAERLPRRTGHFIGAEAVVVPGGQIARRPRAARVVVRVPVATRRLRAALKQMRLPLVRIVRVDDDEVVVFGEVSGGVPRRKVLLPDDGRQEIFDAEYLVHQRAQVMDLMVVDGDEDGAVGTEQLAQQLQARQHHAAPLVVPGQVVAVDGLAEPGAHHRRVDVVVVGPTLVAGVVGRIDIDALDPVVIDRQQRLQRRQIVAVHDQVVVQARRPAQPLVRGRPQVVERHRQMMILDERPALELQ